MSITITARKPKRKIVLDSGSLEKFVAGVRMERTWSCTREKSSMLFCRSRIFRKKSLLSSLTGLTVGGGASGGPAVLYPYVELCVAVVVTGGCRAMNDGMRRARRRIVSGRTVKRYGSRHMNVYTARKESV